MAMSARAAVGDRLDAVETPALIVDLDAFERNVAKMKRAVTELKVRLRPHAKTHKSPDIARIQIDRGGARGICCQTLDEAEAMIERGVGDVLITNQIYGQAKIKRLAELAQRAPVKICVDDPRQAAALEAAMAKAGRALGVLVEIDVGQGRCGVAPGEAAATLAKAVARSPHLRFLGLQAYHGAAQHIAKAQERRAAIEEAGQKTKSTVNALKRAGLKCAVIGGAGTGSFGFEGASGVWDELQCGSYVFMDRHYLSVVGTKLFEPALYVLSSVISVAVPGKAVLDAGLKAHSLDSGPPKFARRLGKPLQRHGSFRDVSDEHITMDNPGRGLDLGDRVLLIPGHCDPTVAMHATLIGVRFDRVEALWPIARP